MKLLLLSVLLLTTFSISTMWQPANPLGFYVSAPSFSNDNNTMYCSKMYSIYRHDIFYYNWNGYQWVDMGRVPGDLNSDLEEEEPFITANGQNMYFQRTVSLSSSHYNICVADWDGSGFNNSRALGSQINGTDNRFPSITQDGLKLYYSKSTGSGFKIYESTWNGSAWNPSIMLPSTVNGSDSSNRTDVTVSPDGNEIYFSGAPPYTSYLCISIKVGGNWQQWQYCDYNVNHTGCTIYFPALTYDNYSNQKLYYWRTNESTIYSLRSPLVIEPFSVGKIKSIYR